LLVAGPLAGMEAGERGTAGGCRLALAGVLGLATSTASPANNIIKQM